NIDGPISPDSIVNKRNLKNYNCFIFTYHDQALIPFKLISNYSGVNYTSGLDIIRVSPDHGTAYDMVGKKKQSSRGIINCFKLVNKIASNRIKYDKTQKIFRTKFSH
ncbi:4-hydroxythreonine-4-phosphate dehydrogenase PdxA, partial [Pelagibacterales bacterium SAG-MED31]|nr:4-hydroxythreonine-4-phosphate dehydrogenase PdxA [Pelagibacterales bacterium SAG-MED31]